MSALREGSGWHFANGCAMIWGTKKGAFRAPLFERAANTSDVTKLSEVA